MTARAEYFQQWREANPDKVREKQRRWRAKNHERIQAYNREYMRTGFYGITRAQRDAIYEAQSGACAGCGTVHANDDLQVDHDHTHCPGVRSCGACVRGLLCPSCNSRDVLA